MAMKPVTFGPFIRGVDASTDVLSQPKGSVPRASNLLLTKRGGLKTCDGSGIVNAYLGVPTSGRGRAMCDFFYQPIGVAPYYLRILKALDQHIGAPQNLIAVDGGTGGTLVAATYFYKVTALDGVGGETLVSNEASVTVAVNHKITLTWNVVPNAVSYNVYRSTSTNLEGLLIGTGLPVLQPILGTISVSFSDTGTSTVGTSPLAVSMVVCNGIQLAGTFRANATFSFPSSIAGLLAVGNTFPYTPGSDPKFGGGIVWTVNTINSNQSVTATINVALPGPGLTAGEQSTGGTVAVSQSPPLSDTTQQTGLYAMPSAANGLSYSNANIVALFPADTPVYDGFPGGGGGPPTPKPPSNFGQQGSTASGGLAGNVNLTPQIVQFTNQAVLALGNGFPPQIYSDPNGTTVNPATSVGISAISVDANGVVTITTAGPHNINNPQGAGANVILAGVTNPAYNTNGSGVSAFPTIAIVDSTHLKIVNLSAIGQAASSGGTLTVSTIPVISTFVPSYPVWTTAVSYSQNSIITPTVSNGHYYKAVQGGVSGPSQPSFPTTTGGQISDGSVIWRESGLLNTAAPPPPGCGHVTVYAGSLWMFNTSPSNTANGLDGPTSLRMCDVNNASSWNPINQAFLDKDDGTDGMGLATFTITAQGIPPQGSLVAYKLYAGYQIIGVFGSSNFAIQRIQSDMGLVAPRSLQFVPGFGLMRMTHLGFAVFDGVTDRVVSPQIQPYLFASDDPDVSDIVPMDQSWMAASQSAQTANPPMYVCAIPIGTSNGTLTRILCFDLVLKGWDVVDLPFAISTMAQARSAVSPVVTLMGSFSDGTLQRWQAGDTVWATALAGSLSTAKVSGFVRCPTAASKDAYVRLYARRVIIRGQQNSATMSINVRVAGVYQGLQPIPLPSSGDIQVQGAVGITHDRFDADIFFTGQLTIDAVVWDVIGKPAGLLAGAIS
jgi:hypothetical protein